MSSKRSVRFSAGKVPAGRQRLLFALLTFSSLTSGTALAAGGALPTGGHFVGGAGAITQGGKNLTVNQSTQLGIINWQSFSIGKGNSVNINNGNGATLNRVTGADVTTIEGIASADGELSPVQAAFQACHGLQCGFCTPGFVVSIHAYLDEHPDPTDEELRQGLSGNICRCTGYQGILQAARMAAETMRQG